MSRATIEREMLARLGLPGQAGPEEIEAAYAEIVAYLEAAPHELRSWAHAEVAAADEAYAVLSDPSASVARADVQDDTARSQPRRSTKAERAEKRAAAATPAPAPALPRRRLSPLARVAVAAGVVLGLLTAGYIVYASDVPAVPGLTGTPAPESTALALDTARISSLMESLSSDPNNTSALQELADIYFDAGDYATAADWENKVLKVTPDDVTAHLALGAAAYNTGDSATAETHWRRVLELDPKNVEAHYDLGFMYFSAQPPDVDKTIAEWQAVVDIAPDSEIAQTVSTHLETLEEWKASAAPASAGPVTSGSPPATSVPPSNGPASSPAASVAPR